MLELDLLVTEKSTNLIRPMICHDGILTSTKALAGATTCHHALDINEN